MSQELQRISKQDALTHENIYETDAGEFAVVGTYEQVAFAVEAAKRVADAVPLVMTSHFVRGYAVTTDPTEADAWLIQPPGNTV